MALRPGLNVLRVAAYDARGSVVDDSVAVDYTPSGVVFITVPEDGQSLVPDASGTTVVEGQVETDGVPTVSLVANGGEITVPVQSGRFRASVPVMGPVLRVRATIRSEGGLPVRSAPVTVLTTGEPLAVLAIEWPADGEEFDAEVSATWRRRADRLDGAAQPVFLDAVRTAAGGRPEVRYVKNPKPGVYTFEMRYRTRVPDLSVSPILYFPREGGVKARSVRPATLSGSGRVIVAKLLLPEGLVWEDDDWSTGQSQSADSITRFRFPDGVVWTERKQKSVAGE